MPSYPSLNPDDSVPPEIHPPPPFLCVLTVITHLILLVKSSKTYDPKGSTVRSPYINPPSLKFGKPNLITYPSLNRIVLGPLSPINKLFLVAP